MTVAVVGLFSLLPSLSVGYFSSLFSFVVLILVFSYYGGGYGPILLLDYFSFLLVFISVFLFFSCSLSESFSSFSLLVLAIISMGVIFSFSVNNYFLFFFSFEFVFILMFFFLYYMGSSMERVQASFYMLFYTILFSLPFLVGLIHLQSIGFSMFFSLHFLDYGGFITIFFFFVFLVKLPVYGLHLWLPKAHVQASVSGSMVLAGILLKLGAYGIYRFFYLFDNLSFEGFLFSYVFYLSLYGGLCVSFICLRQSDLKMLIAYSSVVHISVALLGILSFTYYGLTGCLLILVSHGFISPCMFYLITCSYLNIGSRSLYVIKGIISISPVYCLFWFLSGSLNLSLPPFMSFISEFYIFSVMGFCGIFSILIIFMLLLICGVYSIFCYVIPSHGYYSFCSQFS